MMFMGVTQVFVPTVPDPECWWQDWVLDFILCQPGIFCLASARRGILRVNELDVCYLAGEYETQEDGDGQLTVAKEDDVKQIRVSWMLKEEPKK